MSRHSGKSVQDMNGSEFIQVSIDFHKQVNDLKNLLSKKWSVESAELNPPTLPKQNLMFE